jgi:hypothetical protein
MVEEDEDCWFDKPYISSLFVADKLFWEPTPIGFDVEATPIIPDIADTGAYEAAPKGPEGPSCN